MKYCVLFGTDFEEIEAVTQIDILRRAGIEIDIYGVGNLELKGKMGIIIRAEKLFEKESDIDVEKYSGIILPGGPGVVTLSKNNEVLKLTKKFFDAGKLVFAVCAAPLVLDRAGILEGKKFTCYPSTAKEIKSGNHIDKAVVVDGNIVTSQGVGTSIDAALKLVEIIVSKEMSEKIAKGIVYSK